MHLTTHLQYSDLVLPQPELLKVLQCIQVLDFLEHSSELREVVLRLKRLTRIRFPPSSKLTSDCPTQERPLMCDIRFCTKYTVLSDGNFSRQLGTSRKLLKDRSKTLPLFQLPCLFDENLVTHVIFEQLSSASPTLFSLLSYRSSSSNSTSSRNTSGSRFEI